MAGQIIPDLVGTLLDALRVGGGRLRYDAADGVWHPETRDGAPADLALETPPGMTATTVAAGILEAFQAAGGGYSHIQSAPAATWTIAHNLGRYPSAVAVLDSAGTVCVGRIDHLSVNSLTVSFGAPFSGRAEVR